MEQAAPETATPLKWGHHCAILHTRRAQGDHCARRQWSIVGVGSVGHCAWKPLIQPLRRLDSGARRIGVQGARIGAAAPRGVARCWIWARQHHPGRTGDTAHVAAARTRGTLRGISAGFYCPARLLRHGKCLAYSQGLWPGCGACRQGGSHRPGSGRNASIFHGPPRRVWRPAAAPPHKLRRVTRTPGLRWVPGAENTCRMHINGGTGMSTRYACEQGNPRGQRDSHSERGTALTAGCDRGKKQETARPSLSRGEGEVPIRADITGCR